MCASGAIDHGALQHRIPAGREEGAHLPSVDPGVDVPAEEPIGSLGHPDRARVGVTEGTRRILDREEKGARDRVGWGRPAERLDGAGGKKGMPPAKRKPHRVQRQAGAGQRGGQQEEVDLVPATGIDGGPGEGEDPALHETAEISGWGWSRDGCDTAAGWHEHQQSKADPHRLRASPGQRERLRLADFRLGD